MRRGASTGQAAVELIAAVPVVIAAALLAWQLAAVVGAGMRAQERARAAAIAAPPGPPGALVTVTETVAVPAVLPGLGGAGVSARAAVRP